MKGRSHNRRRKGSRRNHKELWKAILLGAVLLLTALVGLWLGINLQDDPFSFGRNHRDVQGIKLPYRGMV